MMDTSPVQIDEGLWWVGDTTQRYKLRCNPFLLIDGGSAILFDPGSALDIVAVMENIRKIIPIYDIDAVVASHQDPDLCSGIPLLEYNGFSGVICCHERASHIIRYYKISSKFYIVDANKYQYELKDGSKIRFLFSPYLHFPGAIMSYLEKQKTLFSGDIFGAFSDVWTLYAHENPDYAEAMRAFHEAYMPSHDILKPVMDQLAFLDIEKICPQHGSIITRDVRNYIEILKDLPCGRLLQPVHWDLLQEGGYLSLCSRVLNRYIAVYGKSEVRKAFKGSPFTIDYTKRIVTKASIPEDQLWDEFFHQILRTKDIFWLTNMSDYIETLCLGYHIPLPDAFKSVVYSIQKDQGKLEIKYQELENKHLELQGRMKSLEDTLSRCPVTGLFNQNFFDLFFLEETQSYLKQKKPFALACMSIDNLAYINLDYGSSEGDASMKNLTYLLKQAAGDTDHVFRLEGSIFALYMTGLSKEEAVSKVSSLKNQVAESSLFITQVTVSIGVFHTDDIPKGFSEEEDDLSLIAVRTARFRLRIAKKLGVNSLVHDSLRETYSQSSYTVMLADIPGMQRELIRKALEQEHYQVIVASSGTEAKTILERDHPDIIVCELMIPKLNAFSIRKWQLGKPEKLRIPFILMSSNKNETTVRRAIGLRITHFLQRPVMLVELLGIIELITARLQIAEE